MTWWPSRPTSNVPTHFTSQRTGEKRTVRVTPRRGATAREQRNLAQQLDSVAWQDLHHAYGPAGEVPALLFAVTLGADQVRRDAWWELWGNVHHQGTVYEATPACVPFIAQLAAEPEHPDRVNALSFLRQIAVGDGEFTAQTRDAVEQHLPVLLEAWEQQPELVQRALLLLASAFPNRLASHPEMLDQLPPRLRTAWDELASAGGNPTALAMAETSGEVMDRQDELETWAFAGRGYPCKCSTVLGCWTVRCPGCTTPAASPKSGRGSRMMRRAWTTWTGCAGVTASSARTASVSSPGGCAMDDTPVGTAGTA